MIAPKIWKVSVIGDQGVGKTSLVKRFVFNTFNGEGERDEGTKVYKKKVGNVLLMIWDVSVYEEHIDRILNGSKAIVIMGDITRYRTYETMDEMAQYINGYKIPKIFVGNKNDLKYRAEFWKDELEELSSKYSSPYFFTSAKTGENVNEIFKYVVEKIK